MILTKTKNKNLSAVDREKEARLAEYARHFDEKYERARNIKKIRNRKRLKEIMTKSKDKQ